MECIIGKATIWGKQKYLVKWLGKDVRHNSWQTADEICDEELIEQYENLNEEEKKALFQKNVEAEKALVKRLKLWRQRLQQIEKSQRNYHYIPPMCQNPDAFITMSWMSHRNVMDSLTARILMDYLRYGEDSVKGQLALLRLENLKISPCDNAR